MSEKEVTFEECLCPHGYYTGARVDATYVCHPSHDRTAWLQQQVADRDRCLEVANAKITHLETVVRFKEGTIDGKDAEIRRLVTLLSRALDYLDYMEDRGYSSQRVLASDIRDVIDRPRDDEPVRYLTRDGDDNLVYE